MHEIEAKIFLTPHELKRLKTVLPVIATFKGVEVKKDTYYGNLRGDFFIRLREKGERNAVLTLKTKKRKGGVELNREIEFPVSSLALFQKLLERSDFKVAAKKQKKSRVKADRHFVIELNRVVGLGDFLEIETFASSEGKIAVSKREIESYFKQLGFSCKRFEPRYYLELLQKRVKNQ